MESRRTSYTAENQSCQRSEGLAEGIYASPISSNSEQKGDLGLTQLPRSQISNASDEAEENAHSIQGLQVNSPVQDDAVVGESHALNLGSDGNGKHGSSGAYNYDWNDIEWASYDFDGAFNGIEELIDGKSTVGEAFSGTSTSPGSTPCDVPAWKVLSSENSRQSAPQTDHRNVVNSKITVKTDRSKKSVSSLGQRPPFRRSDPRDTRPSFSSFSRRPDPSVSQTTNPWRLQRDGHDLHSQTSAPSTDSNDEATHTDRYWLNDHSPYPNLRDEKSQANCSTSLENQMLDNFEMGGVNIGDAVKHHSESLSPRDLIMLIATSRPAVRRKRKMSIIR